MTDIEQKALALVNEVRRERGFAPDQYLDRDVVLVEEALCRAIEQHEAFRQEVSDAVQALLEMPRCDPDEEDLVAKRLARFIIAKPDPLVEAIRECWHSDKILEDRFRAALAKRGGKIVWGEG